MSFEEPNDPRSSEIINNQIQLTDLVMYEEQTPGLSLFNNTHNCVFLDSIGTFLNLGSEF